MDGVEVFFEGVPYVLVLLVSSSTVSVIIEDASFE